MLTKDTLDTIIANAVMATGAHLNAHTPAIILPNEFSVNSVEHLDEHRSRFRGTLRTASMKDFCTYVTNNSGDGKGSPRCFIDADNMTSTAFFNLGTEQLPGHGDNNAELKLKPTAPYKALLQIAGSAMSQRELAEWMEDWRHLLKVNGQDGADIPLNVAIQKIRTINIKATAERQSTDSNFGASRSAMDTIEAAHDEQQPHDLLFTFAPYEDLPPKVFVLRLSIITSEPPKLKLRWVQQESQEEEIAQDFKHALEKDIGGLTEMYVGTFNLGK